MNEINQKPEYWVLSLSGGKDSTALGLEWLARHKADPVTYGAYQPPDPSGWAKRHD